MNEAVRTALLGRTAASRASVSPAHYAALGDDERNESTPGEKCMIHISELNVLCSDHLTLID